MLESLLFEIVVLADGDVVLQRADDRDNPLIKISFSDEALSYVGSMRVEIAKAMIDAAVQTVEQTGLTLEENEELEEFFRETSKPTVLH